MMHSTGLNQFLHQKASRCVPEVCEKHGQDGAASSDMPRYAASPYKAHKMLPHPLLKEKKRKERYRFNQPLAGNWLFSHLTPFACLPNAKIITALSRSLR